MTWWSPLPPCALLGVLSVSGCKDVSLNRSPVLFWVSERPDILRVGKLWLCSKFSPETELPMSDEAFPSDECTGFECIGFECIGFECIGFEEGTELGPNWNIALLCVSDKDNNPGERCKASLDVVASEWAVNDGSKRLVDDCAWLGSIWILLFGSLSVVKELRGTDSEDPVLRFTRGCLLKKYFQLLVSLFSNLI